jgi:hypothetical protein
MSEEKEKDGYTAEEYTPAVKRRKAVGREVKLGHCDNCHRNTVLSDGTCFQCGHGPRIGHG